MDEELRDTITEAYELLDKAWGSLNHGQTQCHCCSTAYAAVDEAMMLIKTELDSAQTVQARDDAEQE